MDRREEMKKRLAEIVSDGQAAQDQPAAPVVKAGNATVLIVGNGNVVTFRAAPPGGLARWFKRWLNPFLSGFKRPLKRARASPEPIDENDDAGAESRSQCAIESDDSPPDFRWPVNSLARIYPGKSNVIPESRIQ